MNPAITVAMQIIGYLVEHKDDIKKLVLQVEGLIPDAPGSSKAAAVKSFIGTALGIESQIEAAWPMAAPFFNLFVGLVKNGAAKAA